MFIFKTFLHIPLRGYTVADTSQERRSAPTEQSLTEGGDHEVLCGKLLGEGLGCWLVVDGLGGAAKAGLHPSPRLATWAFCVLGKRNSEDSYRGVGGRFRTCY